MPEKHILGYRKQLGNMRDGGKGEEEMYPVPYRRHIEAYYRIHEDDQIIFFPKRWQTEIITVI